MTLPVAKTYIEYTPGTWTDVSAYHKHIRTKRGRTRSTDKQSVGTLDLTLNNQLRTFDFEVNVGLRPGKRVKIEAVWNSITYPVWLGFIERIQQTYDPPNYSQTIITATDAIGRLSAGSIGSPWYILLSLLNKPALWYRMGEDQGTVAFDSSGNHFDGTYSGGAVAATGLIKEDSDGAHLFASATPSILAIPSGAIQSTTNTWGISFALKMGATPTGSYLLLDGAYPDGLQLTVDAAGNLGVVIRSGGANIAAATTLGVNVADGVQRFFNIVATAGTYPRIYWDNVDYTNNATAFGTTAPLRLVPYYIGGFNLADFTMDEFMFWGDGFALNSTVRAALKFAYEGWVNDLTYLRANRILDVVGWPSADRDIEVDAVNEVLTTTRLDSSVWEHLERLTASRQGRLYVDRAGKIVMDGRNTVISEAGYTTSRATYGDQPGEKGYIDAGAFTLDLANVANYLTRRAKNELTGAFVEVTINDAPSIALYGIRPASDIESLFKTSAKDQDLASFYLARTRNPRAYTDGLKVNGRVAPAVLWPELLGSELGNRITWKRRPQKIAPDILIEALIEGISHDISGKNWVTTFAIDRTDALRFFQFDSTQWDSPDWRFSA